MPEAVMDPHMIYVPNQRVWTPKGIGLYAGTEEIRSTVRILVAGLTHGGKPIQLLAFDPINVRPAREGE